MTEFEDITDINIEQCEPPVCPDNLVIRITNVDCTPENIFISWVVDNPDNVSLIITQNKLTWSLNTQSFNNVLSSQSALEPYFAQFALPGSEGTVFLKVKMIINGGIYESEIAFINLSDCVPIDDEFVIPAKLCECSAGGVGIPTPTKPVYVKESGVPIVPNGIDIVTIVFKDNDVCYFIDKEAVDDKILLSSLIITDIKLLNSVSFDFIDCDTCCDPGDACELSEINRSGGAEGLTEVFTIGGSDCLELRYRVLKGVANVPVRIIVTDTDSGSILFDSTCDFADTLTTIQIDNIPGITSITLNVIADCLSSGVAEWYVTLICCPIDCPTEWNNDPDPKALFRIEYTTYTIKDHLRIHANFLDAECPQPQGEVIYDTGCVGTCLGQGPGVGVSGSSLQCLNQGTQSNSCAKADCFEVKQSQLPLGVVVDCNCENTTGTLWKVCIIGPDFTFFEEGGNECLCVENSSSSSSSSFSSSSSLSSSSSVSSSSSSVSSSSSSVSSSSSSVSNSSSSVSSSSSSVSNSSSSVSSSSSSVSSSSSSVSSSSSNSSSSSSNSSSSSSLAALDGNCPNCAVTCAGSFTIELSGLTGNCAFYNGTCVVPFDSGCTYSNSMCSGNPWFAVVQCTAGAWSATVRPSQIHLDCLASTTGWTADSSTCASPHTESGITFTDPSCQSVCSDWASQSMTITVTYNP
jgi:hypothetical protein